MTASGGAVGRLSIVGGVEVRVSAVLLYFPSPLPLIICAELSFYLSAFYFASLP